MYVLYEPCVIKFFMSCDHFNIIIVVNVIVDVFHWSCLDHYSRQLPATTAPRGYTCPSCKSPLFPLSNLISPVADVLREKLAGVNWARAGLGLPLVNTNIHFFMLNLWY